MRTRLATLLAAILLAVAGADAISAQGTSGDGPAVEVRVAARRLANGSTEFALQQRSADGAWAERQLPRSRFFPATTGVGRWLASSPLTVSAPDGAAEAELRVAARLRADGRMEFAAQQRGADGEWGERLLPRARFFPANAAVGRWLSSTPLTVTLPAPSSAASDRAALVAFYHATDGPNWLDSRNWLTDRPLGEWGGVRTDDAGRVVVLSLLANDLAGSLPPELGRLAGLQKLVLAVNPLLEGLIPAELGRLTNLRILDLSSTDLGGLIPDEFANLTNLSILHLEDTQLIGCVAAHLRDVRGISVPQPGLAFCPVGVPTPSANRAALVALYEATDGANWNNNTNWLTERPVGQWYGVLADDDDRVVGLYLWENGLAGSLPAELGTLVRLRELALPENQIGGALPAELGALASLHTLSLGYNQLTGPIPAELGALDNLRGLALFYNRLSGPIPAELGGLPHLERLSLQANELSGPIRPSWAAFPTCPRCTWLATT